MKTDFIIDIQQLNPWLKKTGLYPQLPGHYTPRIQEKSLSNPEWDSLWTLLVGPRRAGKTTLGLHLCRQLVDSGRFKSLLYLNCDYESIRDAFTTPSVIPEIIREFSLEKPIFLIDEVQRLKNPGMLLKAIIDLGLDVKWMASGSSQLEIKSKVQEFLTGREIEATILPFSRAEVKDRWSIPEHLIYGSYPQVVELKQKEQFLAQLYKRYIQKDIIEILRLSKPEVLSKLVTLIAHSSGQLVNYQQLATDCRVTSPTIQSYLDILEQTFVLKKVRPFVGNKRTEITNNPIYYFIDNGFRNQALRNFSAIDIRSDAGILVESLVFQEILKLKLQRFMDFDIHFWRTKAQAEVDFVLYKNQDAFIPVEVKFRSMNRSTISRAYRSFLDAYEPKTAIMITKDFSGVEQVGSSMVYFFPLASLSKALDLIAENF